MPDPLAPTRYRAPPGEDLWTRKASAAERWLERAAWIERAGRAAWRRVRAGESPLRAEDRHRLAAADAHRRPGAGPGPGPGPAAEAASPLIYLPALPWGGRFQRPQQLAVAIARRGVRVLWSEAFLRTRLQPQVWVTTPEPALRVARFRLPGRPDPFRQPFPPAAVAALAEALLAGRSAPPAAVLVQLPFWAPLAYELRRRSRRPLIYDRIDLHTGFPGVPAAVGEAEADLLRRSDLVTCTSPHLATLSRDSSRRTVLLRNAVDPALIGPAPFRPPGRPLGGREPVTVAGFVGALDRRIDGAAIEAAARALPGWRFRFAGRVEDPALSELARLPNVELLGEIPHARVAGFLGRLDVGLVPYRDTPLTRAIDPVKLYEMLAAGLPVVWRRLPAADSQAPTPPVVYPYEEPSELARELARARREDSGELHARRIALAAGETWSHRAATLLQHLDALADDLGGAL